jgi:hypothetical protein
MPHAVCLLHVPRPRHVPSPLCMLTLLRALWQMQEDGGVESCTLGRIASYYYMRHQTMAIFALHVGPGMDIQVRQLAAAGSCKSRSSKQQATSNKRQLTVKAAAAAADSGCGSGRGRGRRRQQAVMYP